jgi:hypothetical protein
MRSEPDFMHPATTARVPDYSLLAGLSRNGKFPLGVRHALIRSFSKYLKAGTSMRKLVLPSLVMLLCGLLMVGQAKAQDAAAGAKPADDYSGMYTFLQDGEFVQITVEDAGRVTGFVSRYGEQESDRGAFLDQFFKQGKLEGKNLTFTTETVHAVWYEFKGTVDRGDGKKPGDEAYYVLKGTLTQYTTDVNKKTTSRAREVVFKAFPQDENPASPAKN